MKPGKGTPVQPGKGTLGTTQPGQDTGLVLLGLTHCQEPGQESWGHTATGKGTSGTHTGQSNHGSHTQPGQVTTVTTQTHTEESKVLLGPPNKTRRKYTGEPHLQHKVLLGSTPHNQRSQDAYR
jgi:hypothetical protein